jgi:hypothetical protein
MKKAEAARDPELLELETQTHEAMTPWIDNHIERYGGKLRDTGYNPDTQTYHRLDEGYTPPTPIPFWVPNSYVVRKIKKALTKEIGSAEKVDEQVRKFKETPAFPGASYSVSEEVERRWRNKQTTAMLVDHLEKGDLRDVALAAAVLEAAIGKKKFREQTATVLGLNIGRQEFQGRIMAETILKIMGIIWVMQDTDNRKALDIPPKAIEIVGDNADKAFLEFFAHGGVIAEVAAGSAMILDYDENGRPKWTRPTVRGAVAGLMQMDAFLPVGVYQGEMLPGPMEVADKPKELSRSDKKEMVVRALSSLAVNDAILTGYPVEFEDLKTKGSTTIVYPPGYREESTV